MAWCLKNRKRGVFTLFLATSDTGDRAHRHWNTPSACGRNFRDLWLFLKLRPTQHTKAAASIFTPICGYPRRRSGGLFGSCFPTFSSATRATATAPTGKGKINVALHLKPCTPHPGCRPCKCPRLPLPHGILETSLQTHQKCPPSNYSPLYPSGGQRTLPSAVNYKCPLKRQYT